MLLKIKNLTNNDIVVHDMGITILAQSYYDVSNKKYKSSENLIHHITSGVLCFVKSESPEILYNMLDSLQYIMNGVISVPKLSTSGENITLKNEYGHLDDNNIINWTFSKYLSEGKEFSEKMYIPFDKTVIINSFTSGSFNVPSSAKLELFEWNSEFNDHIRINKDIRIQECYLTTISTNLTTNSDTIYVNNISDVELNLVYEIETKNGTPLYRKVINIDVSTNGLTLNLPIPDFTNISSNAKISLVDRPIAENNSQLSNNVITWISPLKIDGLNSSYLKVTIINEDISEPGYINSAINGWIGYI